MSGQVCYICGPSCSGFGSEITLARMDLGMWGAAANDTDFHAPRHRTLPIPASVTPIALPNQTTHLQDQRQQVLAGPLLHQGPDLYPEPQDYEQAGRDQRGQAVLPHQDRRAPVATHHRQDRSPHPGSRCQVPSATGSCRRVDGITAARRCPCLCAQGLAKPPFALRMERADVRRNRPAL